MSEKCVHEWYYRIVDIVSWQFFCIRCGEKLSMDKFSDHASDLEKRMAELGKATACIAELEMKIRHNALWQASEDAEERAHLEKLVLDLKKRIAELEEQVWNLNLENERLEEAYWIDETISPDGTLKPSVRKLLERLEKAETDLRLSDDLVKALDNRIAELEAAQRWRVVADGEMPELDQDVFAVVEGEIKVGHFYQELDFIEPDDDEEGNISFSVFDDGLLVATHWMPLPELPKEREK